MDFPELIAEVTERTGYSDTASRAALWVTLAETDLNKRLRVGPSEVISTLLTDASGDTDLPDDFGELRELFILGQRVLNTPIPDVYEEMTPSYTIQGRKLKTTYANTTVTLHYYAGLASLAWATTNWLLEQEPEVYIYALMRQAFLAKLDAEKALAADQVLGALIDEVNRVDRLKRFGRLPYRVRGVTP